MDNCDKSVGLRYVMRYSVFLIVLGFPGFGNSFWPASYRVDLSDEKIFVITAGEDDDENEENENEMIQPEDLAEVAELVNDEERYKPLHSHVEHYNRRAAEAAKQYSLSLPFLPTSMEEINLSNEEEPFIAGFKRELDEYNFDRPVKSTSNEDNQKLNRGIFEKSLKPRSMEMRLGNRAKREDEEDILSLTPQSADDLVETMSPRNQSLYLDGHATPNPEDSQSVSSSESETQPSEEYEDEKTSVVYNHETQHGSESSERNELIDRKYNRFVDSEFTTAPSELEEKEEEIYDYDNFRAEYDQQIEESKASNATYNYTDSGVPEETPADAIKKIVEFDMPRNCTEEELTKFGVKSFECLVFDYQNAKNESDVRRVLARTWNVVKVWICIYVSIAIPCWCQKGWCCCCFRCSMCFPNERILMAKDYYARNEPGILVDQPTKKDTDPQPVKYKPTLFEMDAYEDFESAIRNL